MSKFNEYARKLDAIANAAFKESKDAAAALERAERAKRQNTQRAGAVSADYAAASARAQADYFDAIHRQNDVRNKMDDGEYRQQIKKLRGDLEAAVNAAYQVQPNQIDANALELLKSGIMTADEYKTMLEKAVSNGNATMVRLIGKYADSAAASVTGEKGFDDSGATALRYVSDLAKGCNGSAVLEKFDFMVDVYNRAINNPGMIEEWDNLTGETVETF